MGRFNRHTTGLFVLSLVLLPDAVSSREPIPPGYESTAAAFGIPGPLLYAVALTESGRSLGSSNAFRPWPWTLNVAGQGYYFESRGAAWRALSGWLEAGRRSIDIGLMQVNWRYHENRLGDAWQALDPYYNLAVGAAILKACAANARDWMVSVGCYHAPSDPDRAARYRERVNARLRQIEYGG